MEVGCICCAETVGTEAATEIDGSVVCHTCVQTLFGQALLYEHSYPVKFGPIRLEPEPFKHILGEDFIKRFRKREEQYKSNVVDRNVCTQLGLEMQTSGLERGKHFQFAPCCHLVVELADACHEMSCPRCRPSSSFCFHCGKAIKASDLGHWTRAGGCPRYPPREGEEPIYDDDHWEDSDDDEREDSDDEEVRHPAQELLARGLIYGLASSILRRAVINGQLKDQADEHWIRQRIFWFLNRYAPGEAAHDWVEVDHVIRASIHEIALPVREVGLLWREMGYDAPRPLTELQQAVVHILENMDIDWYRTGGLLFMPDELNIVNFVPRHQQIETTLLTYDLENGQGRLQREYPLVMALWDTYNRRIPAGNRISWASELQLISWEMDSFKNEKETELLLIQVEDGPARADGLAQIRDQLSFASEVHFAVGEMLRLQRSLPQLSYLRSFAPRDAGTEAWFMRHRELIRIFGQYEADLWGWTLRRHYEKWQAYIALLPSGLHHHLAST